MGKKEKREVCVFKGENLLCIRRGCRYYARFASDDVCKDCGGIEVYDEDDFRAMYRKTKKGGIVAVGRPVDGLGDDGGADIPVREDAGVTHAGKDVRAPVGNHHADEFDGNLDKGIVVARRGGAAAPAVAAQGRLSAGPAVAHSPEAVTAQYRRAVGAQGLATLEAVRFGAMLVDVEATIHRGLSRQTTVGDGSLSQTNYDWKFDSLSRQTIKRGGDRRSGTGLKEWLAEHCPDVDYDWGMKQCRIARCLQHRFNVDKRLPLAVMLPMPPEGVARQMSEAWGEVIDAEYTDLSEPVREKREEIGKFLESKSLRQLEFDFGIREPGPKIGRPFGTPSEGRRAKTAVERTEEAVQVMDEVWSKLRAFVTGPLMEIVPLDRRRTAATALKDYAKMLVE